MRVAFVNDSVERLGVEYLSAVLKEKGHDVRLFADPQLFDDVFVYSKRLSQVFDYRHKLLKEIKNFQPDLIGFSVDTESYQWALRLARFIKKAISAPIIFGGIHPTSAPESVLAEDVIDIICIGEGEYPLLELAESMESGAIDYSIRNLWFKRDGQLIKNTIRPLIEDLARLPLRDKDLFYANSPHFRKGYSIIASRGCPYACSYCCHSYLRKLYQMNGRYYRLRPVADVIEEISGHHQRFKFNTVVFNDDCFGYDLDWLKEFASLYPCEVNIRFNCTTYPSLVTEESVALLKAAGCCSITLGIQSWDDHICQEWFNRNVSVEQMSRAMSLIKQADIQLVCDNIFNVPGQTEDAFIQSLNHYVDVKPDRMIFNQLKFYPGVSITEKALSEKVFDSGRYERILNGKDQEGVYLNSITSGNNRNRRFIKMKSFLYVLDFLPRRLARFAIKKKLYRYFPGFLNPSLFSFYRNVFSFDIDTQFFKKRMISRYQHYTKKILWAKIKGSSEKEKNEKSP